MDDQARKAQREYLRAWRKRNPDKVRAANRKYWQRRAQRLQKSGCETEVTERNEVVR